MRLRLLPLLLFGSAAALPAAADDVFLNNGNSFEGVIAEVTATQVRIRMPGGELSLPRSAVARVEKGEAPFAEFLAREKALRRDPDATAADWVELARWAKAQGLATATREAALQAARLDPQLAALEPLLRGLGYVYDRELARWIPYAESTRRCGFVEHGGAWITRAEHERGCGRASARSRSATAGARRRGRPRAPPAPTGCWTSPRCSSRAICWSRGRWWGWCCRSPSAGRSWSCPRLPAAARRRPARPRATAARCSSPAPTRASPRATAARAASPTSPAVSFWR